MSTNAKTVTPAEQQLVNYLQELGKLQKDTPEWNEKFNQVWNQIYKYPYILRHLQRLERYDPKDRNDFEIIARINEHIHVRLRGNAISSLIKVLGDDLYKQSSEQVIVRVKGLLRKIGKHVAQDIFREIKNKQQRVVSLNAPQYNNEKEGSTMIETFVPPNLDFLDDVIRQDQEALKANLNQALHSYIEIDPDGILRSYYPGKEEDGYQHASLWEVAKRRLLQDPPQTWQAISQGFNVPFSTISSYGNTNLNTVLLWVFIQKIDQHQGKLWWNVIEKDPTNDLKDLHLPNLPACHSQYLAQELLLKSPPKKMSTLAREFKIPTKKLQKFWDEQCLKHLWLMV
jgi:hypothetical protein